MIDLSPSNFKEDLYGWITNQISHTAISTLWAYLTGDWKYALIFWIIWETVHVVMSRDVQDFFEDLFFEISGLIIVLYPETYIPIYLIIFTMLAIRRIYYGI